MKANEHPAFKPIQEEIDLHCLWPYEKLFEAAFEAGYKAGLDDLWQRLIEAKEKMNKENNN